MLPNRESQLLLLIITNMQAAYDNWRMAYHDYNELLMENQDIANQTRNTLKIFNNSYTLNEDLKVFKQLYIRMVNDGKT